MMVTPDQVAEKKKEQRENMDAEDRRITALEEIADTMECVRIHLAGIEDLLERDSRRPL